MSKLGNINPLCLLLNDQLLLLHRRLHRCIDNLEVSHTISLGAITALYLHAIVVYTDGALLLERE